MNLINKLSLFIILLAFASCTVTEEPQFVRVEELSLRKINNNEYALSGDLVYYNPNDVGGTLTGLDLELSLDNYSLGNVNKKLEVAIKPATDFSVPLDHLIDFSKLKLDQELFTLLLNAAMSKEVDFSYKGSVLLKIAGVKISLPVENTETIPFSKK